MIRFTNDKSSSLNLFAAAFDDDY